MKELIVHEDADAEILAEALYYEEQSAGLGLDFISEVESAYRQVVDAPGRWQASIHSTRRVRLVRFPHFVYYIELPAVIWIVTVAPTSRRPFYWQHRLNEPPPG